MPQFKALDQVLQTFNKDTGEKQAISYRCIDIDRLVPQIMGVSKARRHSCLLRFTMPFQESFRSLVNCTCIRV